MAKARQPVGLNFVLRRYFRAFSRYRRQFLLTREQHLAYARLRDALRRKCADFFADVSDLRIEESIRIAHLAMGQSVELIPVFFVPRPIVMVLKSA